MQEEALHHMMSGGGPKGTGETGTLPLWESASEAGFGDDEGGEAAGCGYEETYNQMRRRHGLEAEPEWRKSYEDNGTIFRNKSSGNANGPDAIWSGQGTDPGFDIAELKPTTMFNEGVLQLKGRAKQGYYGRGSLFFWEGTPGNFTFSGPVYQIDLGPDPQISMLFGDPE